MKNDLFAGKFTIRIDSSRCTSLVSGSAFINGVHDVWKYSDLQIESGKIYALVGEYGQGNMYLSYLLGGKVQFGELKLYCNDAELSTDDLLDNSWNLEPSKEPYGNNLVRSSIEKSYRKEFAERELSGYSR